MLGILRGLAGDHRQSQHLPCLVIERLNMEVAQGAQQIAPVVARAQLVKHAPVIGALPEVVMQMVEGGLPELGLSSTLRLFSSVVVTSQVHDLPPHPLELAPQKARYLS